MDDLDKQIINRLSADARTSVSTLARQLKLARTTVQARLERLERKGVIAGYTLKLGQATQLHRIRATVLLQVEPRGTASVVARLRAMPEVEIVHTSSGRFDMILQLVSDTTAEMDQVLDLIGGIKGVRSSESLIHLSTKFDRVV
ncbi:MAG: Lrp/AsnC family transcriptional regulator [Alphaproteobacteria bacterium]|nr:Lrp/AsnC family transcriptional regulator [Alphaproteobacteria bacterium]